MDQIHTSAASLAALRPVLRRFVAEQFGTDDMAGLAAGYPQAGTLLSSRTKPALEVNSLLRSVNYGKSEVFLSFRILSEDWDESLNILWRKPAEFPVKSLD